MTEAIQITVNKEMEKRMDDSSSIVARMAREPDLSAMPWVESVIKGQLSLKKKGRS
jgi:hypothetical protein